jgi:hypothetical protein
MLQKLVLVFFDLSSKFLFSLTVLPSGNGHSLQAKILRVSLTNSQFLSRDVYSQITQAIQVAVSIKDEKVKRREIGVLVEALYASCIKAYKLKKGMTVTENDQETLEIEGLHIHVQPLWKWLLGL